MSEATSPQSNILTKLKNDILWDILDQSAHSIVITGADGTILHVNEYFVELTGYTAAEAIGNNPRILNSGLQESDFHAHLWETISRGKTWRGRFCNRKKSGELFWEDATIYPVKHGDQTYFIAIKKDITEQVTAQNELQETQSTLRNMIDAVTESLLMLDQSGDILVANKTFSDRFGMSPEVMTQQNIQDILPDEVLDSRMEIIRSVFDNGQKVIDVDRRFDRYMENLFFPVFNEDNTTDRMVIFGRDITTEVDARNKLRKSEELHRTVLQIISDAVFIIDDQSRFTYICPTVDNIFGYSAREIESMGTINRLLPELDYDVNELEQKKEITNIETNIKDKHGQSHSLLVNIKRVDIAGGTRLFTCRDITDRKQAESSLRYYSMVLSNVSDAVILTDMDFNLVSLNAAAESIYGWQTHEAIGQNWGELAPTRYFNQTSEKVIKDFRENGYWTGEVIQTCRDGREIHVMASVTIVRDTSDKPIGVVAINRDITDRVQTELALKSSERRFRRAIESAPFPIMIHAENGDVIMVNQMWTELTGYQLEDIPTMGAWLEHTQQQATISYKSNLHRLHQSERIAYDGTFEIRTRSHDTLIWDCQSVKLGKMVDGRHLLMSVATDITRQHELQAQATQAQILEAELKKERELSGLKERLMSTISHEFRTPLTIMQTSADLLHNYFDKLDDVKRKKHLDRIVEQIEYTVKLLDQTMQLRYAQSGRVDFAPSPLDLEMFCMTIFDKMQFADNDKHEMQFVCTTTDVDIVADANLLEHVLQNLLSNALKYTPEGKTITMTLSRNTDWMILQVVDEGIGIPKQDLKRLFEPYHRASNASEIQGTGLGLAIVKEYVELHGGTVTCESRVNVGTQFTVELPAKQV